MQLRSVAIRRFPRVDALAATRSSPRMVMTAATAGVGDWVQVAYKGTLDDGSVFDESNPKFPLEFVIGEGKVIKGFDRVVTGLSVGGKNKQRVSPEDAYGQRDDKLTIKFPAKEAPPGLKQGAKVQLSNGAVALVTSLDSESITLDLNHELAGTPLTFEVELLALCPKASMKTVTFGAGCFWSVELAYQRTAGVLETQVGYCNGTTDNPTYEDVCSGETGHCEVVKVTYNPSVVSLDDLLQVFWNKHDPTTLNRQGGDSGTQYRSGIYCDSEEDIKVAKASIAAVQSRFKSPIVTEVALVSKYTAAEEYHQAYLAKGGRNGRPQDPSKGCKDPIRCYG